MFTKRYLKPGPGVPKEEPPKHPVLKFFQLVTRKFWAISKLNLLYIAASIPFFAIVFLASGIFSAAIVNSLSGTISQLYGFAQNSVEFQQALASYDLGIRFTISFVFMMFFGAGPASAGYSYILKCFCAEAPVFIWSDFWEHTVKNIKQSVVVFIIDLIILSLFGIAILVYSHMNGTTHYIRYIIILFAEFFAIMHFYVYAVMITFELPVKYIYKNSLIFTFMKLPANILLFIINVLIHIIAPCALLFFAGSVSELVVFVLLELLFLPAFTGFMTMFFTYPAVDKIINNR